MTGIGRVAFLGGGAFGLPLLERVVAVASDVLVVTHLPRPAGRGLLPRESPIGAFARVAGLRIATPPRLASEEGHAAIAGFAPDGLLLAAYGQIVPASLLAAAPRPPLNVHPSLLPRHRGPAPIAGAILAADTETGVTLIVMVREVDAGPIAGQWRVPLDADEDAVVLERRLAAVAAREVPAVLESWARGDVAAVPQPDDGVTYTRPLRRSDGAIDWTRTASEVDRGVRALQPWPGAWTTHGARPLHVRRGRPLPDDAAATPGEVLRGPEPRVACGRGTYELVAVQPAGRPVMPAADWLRGLRADRVVLGAPPG
ncbi:MAG: methionyl-tRNA formyltransferase [Candidatus Limnocylindria bacterium]